jgi:hypothetical protein
MSAIKRGTSVEFVGSINSNNIDTEAKIYLDKYGINIGDKGKTCGRFKGGWIRVTWSLSNGLKATSVPMRMNHFKIIDKDVDNKVYTETEEVDEEVDEEVEVMDQNDVPDTPLYYDNIPYMEQDWDIWAESVEIRIANICERLTYAENIIYQHKSVNDIQQTTIVDLLEKLKFLNEKINKFNNEKTYDDIEGAKTLCMMNKLPRETMDSEWIVPDINTN